MIYTGGHDGSLIAWNFETGYVKFYLHDYDPTCMSKAGNYIKESKSVDCVNSLKSNLSLAFDFVQKENACFSFSRLALEILGL